MSDTRGQLSMQKSREQRLSLWLAMGETIYIINFCVHCLLYTKRLCPREKHGVLEISKLASELREKSTYNSYMGLKISDEKSCYSFVLLAALGPTIYVRLVCQCQ